MCIYGNALIKKTSRVASLALDFSVFLPRDWDDSPGAPVDPHLLLPGRSHSLLLCSSSFTPGADRVSDPLSAPAAPLTRPRFCGAGQMWI